MKRKNITAFILGVIAAGLLWQFYLKPKYDISTGNKEVMEALKAGDMEALDQATADIQGQVLYSTAEDERGEYAAKENPLTAAQTSPESFDFQSTANKPLDPYQQAAQGDKRKSTKIILDSNNITVKPSMADKMPEPLSEEEVIAENQELKNRITMIKVPVKYHLIQTQAQYNAFKKDNPGPYNAKVDFSKDMLVLLESDSTLSSGFFEIEDITQDDKEITVYYRVNIIGTSQRQDIMPYKVIAKSTKKVVLKQIK